MTVDVTVMLAACGLGRCFISGQTRVEALRAVSLEMREGEFLAIMGPSGCGKSTLLNLLGGLDRPDAGTVVIGDVDLYAMNEKRRTLFRRSNIGLIFQSFNLIANLTVRENVLLPLLLSGDAAGAQGECDMLLARLGLAGREGFRPQKLSGGEQQRVAIARALLANPALILADEPTGSLDYENGQHLCALLSELCRERGRTVLMVTHEPAVAAWAGRVLVMKDGAIVGEIPGGQDANGLAASYHGIIGAGVRGGGV